MRRHKLVPGNFVKIAAAVVGVGLGAAAQAQVSGYVKVNNGEDCTPPVCYTQTYDSWGGGLPVWHLVTHNFNPGGGSGMHWTSTAFYESLFVGGNYSPYLAGDDAFEPGHAFNLLSPSGTATGCPFLHVANSGNSTSNFTQIDHPSLNGAAAARLLVTPVRQDSRIHEHIGVWYSTANLRWNSFYQDASASIVTGQRVSWSCRDPATSA